jgi:hypothetical protein
LENGLFLFPNLDAQKASLITLSCQGSKGKIVKLQSDPPTILVNRQDTVGFHLSLPIHALCFYFARIISPLVSDRKGDFTKVKGTSQGPDDKESKQKPSGKSEQGQQKFK